MELLLSQRYNDNCSTHLMIIFKFLSKHCIEFLWCAYRQIDVKRVFSKPKQNEPSSSALQWFCNQDGVELSIRIVITQLYVTVFLIVESGESLLHAEAALGQLAAHFYIKQPSLDATSVARSRIAIRAEPGRRERKHTKEAAAGRKDHYQHPFELARLEGHLDIYELTVDWRNDINNQNEANKTGTSLVHKAVDSRNVDLVERMPNRGLDRELEVLYKNVS